MKQTAHKGTTAKHAGTTKHVAGKGKHHPAKAKKAATHHHAAKKAKVHTAAKTHTVAKPRKLAQGDAQRGLLRLCPAPGGGAEPRQPLGASLWAAPLADIACCPVLALAESLKLSGRLCGADDVLTLYGHLASDADAGATILATLEAAAEYGLAGMRPRYRPVDLAIEYGCASEFDAFDVNWRHQAGNCGAQGNGHADQFFGVQPPPSVLGCADCLPDPCSEAERAHVLSQGFLLDPRPAAGRPEIRCDDIAVSRHALDSCTTPLILGLELPGPHAVLAERGRWWSWSQPWPPAAFPDAVIEEAWAVTWP